MTQDYGRLLIRFPDGSEQTYLLDREQITIGRGLGNTIKLLDKQVSHKHARLDISPHGVMLIDVGSRNGTYIGELKLPQNQPHPLSLGSSFEIRPYILTYQAPQLDATLLSSLQVAEEAEQPPVPLPGPPAPPTPQPEGRVPLHTWPVPPPPGPLSHYLHYLPVIFQDSELLGHYLLIFESLWEPLEQRQDFIDMYFDPQTAPTSFLAWLATWFGLALDEQWPEDRQRRFVARAYELYRARGTEQGLIDMIETCTGLTPDIQPVEPHVFQVGLEIPPSSGVSRDFVDELIRAHKPAHAGYILKP